MKTSHKQTSLFTEDQLTSSQEASHANHTAKQEKDLERKMTATSGLKCLEQFGKLPRATSWAKTFMGLLIGQEGWYSKRCKLTWRLKGTKSNRLYFQLVPSTLPTDEIGFGLLLGTPRAQERPRSEKFREGRTPSPIEFAEQYGIHLSQMAENRLLPTPKTFIGLLPTPLANDGSGGSGYVTNPEKNKEKGGQLSLARACKISGLLPTPTCQNAKGKENSPSQQHKSELAIVATTGTTSQLNPQFVAEMMGFPTDWTALPFQNGATNQSKPTETQ